MRSIKELCEGEHAYFKCSTDKEPLSYRLGEDMHFRFELCDGEGERLSCPKIIYLTRIDGEGERETWNTVDGNGGVLELSLKPSIAGFVYVRVIAADEDGKPHPSAETFHAGAGADVESIRQAVEEPSDFDEFWKDTVSRLNLVEPKLLHWEKLDPVKWGFEPEKYTTYEVRVQSIDGEFASGFLSIPYDAAEGECALRLDFHGHGIRNAYGKYVPKTIVFDVIAHSFPATASEEEIKRLSEGELKHYGFEPEKNCDRDKVYFKNMILRDLQAARFLTSYFGSDRGGRLWDGKSIGTRGGSQGAFQAMAVSALLPHFDIHPTFIIFHMPWMCDIGGVRFASRYKSGFLPEYTDALRYYDTVNFAKRVKCRAEGGETGLGDNCAVPSATISCYNALDCEKYITYYQNGVHGGHGKFFEVYRLESL